MALAFAFAVTNGAHDASNAIATLVATRAARPLHAVVLAAVFNLLGPLVVGAAVADTIGGIVTLPPARAIAGHRGRAARRGRLERLDLVARPAGELRPRARRRARRRRRARGRPRRDPLGRARRRAPGGRVRHAHRARGVAGPRSPRGVRRSSGRGARRAAARPGVGGAGTRGPSGRWRPALAFSHGSNDAQKAAGVVAALLVADGRIGHLAPPTWVELGCAAALTVGTTFGGWRIARTVGRRIYPIRAVDGLASSGAAASVIFGASLVGGPVSTSQVVASSVVGVGGGRRRWHHVNWATVSHMGWRGWSRCRRPPPSGRSRSSSGGGWREEPALVPARDARRARSPAARSWR